jgi:hypothetical protein
MAFTLWLSAEEDRILGQIMRIEGTHNKEEAVIQAIRDKGALLMAERSASDVAARSASDEAARSARSANDTAVPAELSEG